MRISARVRNEAGRHQVDVSTNGHDQVLSVPPKANGPGSSVNGGELLFLALATCYCNDVYREAAKRGIQVEGVAVDVEGEFEAEGSPLTRVRYRATIRAQASAEAIRELAGATDRVAEIQNTVRAGIPVTLERIDIVVV
jgi:uncharacterized OsmC-like protein